MIEKDVISIVSSSVILTILCMTIFVNSFVNFESRFVQWFSHITSQPRWFTIWILVMVLWVPVRRLLIEHGLLNTDSDFLVATILWSCIPFMVENLLKSTTAKQMVVLTDLVVAVKAELDHSGKRDEVLLALLTQLLDRIEDVEVTQDGSA
jgi:hypothetical protein